MEKIVPIANNVKQPQMYECMSFQLNVQKPYQNVLSMKTQQKCTKQRKCFFVFMGVCVCGEVK